MIKRIIVILKVIPVLSALLSYILIHTNYTSLIVKYIVLLTFILSFFGFLFFFIGRKKYKDDKIISILNVLDLLSTIYVIALYIIVIFIFGL